METGRDTTGQREGYKVEGDRSSGFRLRFHRDSVQSKDFRDWMPIWSEDFIEIRTSGWLLCSSDLSVFTPMSESSFFIIKTSLNLSYREAAWKGVLHRRGRSEPHPWLRGYR